MIDKKDYNDFYKQVDLMYANEIDRLMREMGIKSFHIPDDSMDAVSLVKGENDVFPHIVMRDGSVMDIDQIIGMGERLYNIVYAEYQSQYKETVIDKIKCMDFDDLVRFMGEIGIITDTLVLFRMSNNNVWRSLMDEFSPIHVIKQINDAYIRDEFEYHDGYVLAEKYNRMVILKSFTSVSEIVGYFEDEVNEKCSPKSIS